MRTDTKQIEIPATLRQAIVDVVQTELRAALGSARQQNSPEFLTVGQTLATLRLSRTGLYRCIRAGRLTLVKRGRRSLLDAAEVAAFADGLRAAARCKAK